MQTLTQTLAVPAILLLSTPLYAQDESILLAHNDVDGDLVVNTIDIDDDNDGIPDVFEISADGTDRDSDGDGMPDRMDLDSDNDGILDWLESGAIRSISLSSLRRVGARLTGTVGANGLLDVFETFPESDELAYTLANTDVNEDDIPDYLDLDSDNDGWPDFEEAGVARRFDADRDARVDAPPGTVGDDGVADFLQRVNDRACCDLDGDGQDDIMPLNTDSADLPDFQDLDSDNDGIMDIVELNGTDADGNGHVDNFMDSSGGPDGMDDGLITFPYTPVDANGNGVFDHVEYVASVETPDPMPDPGEQPDPVDPVGPLDPIDPADPSIPQDDPGEGVVRTGLGASGCTIFAGESDVMLHLLLLTSLAIFFRRWFIKKRL